MKRIIFLFTLNIFFVICGFSQSDTSFVHKITRSTDISGQWFLGFNYNLTQKKNKFFLKRGYFTIKTKLNKNISVRYTQDITLDNEGSDAGNVEIRLKYLYMKIKAPRKSFLRHTYLEFGLVHRPWIDFEQKINKFRVQDKMFSEKYKMLSSADFGFTYAGKLGGDLPEATKLKLGNDYSGRYGTFSLGLYNGGGYHAVEMNNNKIFEGRLTVRPLPVFFPELQFSYVNSFGLPNVDSIKNHFIVNLLGVSVRNSFFSITFQYFISEGNYTGKYYTNAGSAIGSRGISTFGSFFLIKNKLSVFGRYDYFNLLSKQKSLSGGISFHFLKSKFVVFYQDDIGVGRTKQLEATLEVSF